MQLTDENVVEIFCKCLAHQYEKDQASVIAEGVQKTAQFNSARLEASKDDIISMIEQLPDQFKAKSGGGRSFLNMCNTAQGEQWTGFHTNVDRLLMLGLATDKLAFLMPRDMWSVLPGEMPYVVIKD